MKPQRYRGPLPGSPEMARTSRSQPIREAGPSQHSDPLLGMSRSYEGFLRSVSVEALAELCAEAVQATGSGEPTTHEQRRTVMHHAYELHLQKQWAKDDAAMRDRGARRRARKRGATIEHFTRQEIIDRDNRTCHICRRTNLTDKQIHIDHVIPLSKGGEHSRANCKVSCAPCNIRKSDIMPSDTPVYHPAT